MQIWCARAIFLYLTLLFAFDTNVLYASDYYFCSSGLIEHMHGEKMAWVCMREIKGSAACVDTHTRPCVTVLDVESKSFLQNIARRNNIFGIDATLHLNQFLFALQTCKKRVKPNSLWNQTQHHHFSMFVFFITVTLAHKFAYLLTVRRSKVLVLLLPHCLVWRGTTLSQLLAVHWRQSEAAVCLCRQRRKKAPQMGDTWDFLKQNRFLPWNKCINVRFHHFAAAAKCKI